MVLKNDDELLEIAPNAPADEVKRAFRAQIAVGGGYNESQLHGFDLALVPKSKLFGRNKNPKLLGRFVSHLDREAVADAWDAGREVGRHEERRGVRPPAGQRKKSRGAKVTRAPQKRVIIRGNPGPRSFV